jgi:proteic killer suppression protein
MRFKFADRRLELLYTTGIGSRKYGDDAVNALLRSTTRIDAALDERDLRRQKGLRYERLRGDRAGQYSVRLNRQWRLILMPAADEEGNFLWIIELVDYH